jgi:hypothetical protein
MDCSAGARINGFDFPALNSLRKKSTVRNPALKGRRIGRICGIAKTMLRYETEFFRKL